MERVRQCFNRLPDHRQPSNATKYSIVDAALSALSVFFMQSPSFLAHQRDMEKKRGRSNVQNLFGAYEIPCDNQIRKLLDPIAPDAVGSVFWEIYRLLDESGALQGHRGINETLLCGIDGTQYFSSPALSCANCSPRTHNEQVRYTHSVLAPVLVAPDQPQVISLEPEFIWPQDGSEKQDCEQAALKRWLQRHAQRFAPHTVTLLADDLHSRQPTCELCLTHHVNFLFVCLPDSHPTLYQEVELLERLQPLPCLVLRQWNGRSYQRTTYRYLNDLPLRTGEDALCVNWCEVVVADEQSGELRYRNAFITNHAITQENVARVVHSARTRWKTENENHNTLKNHGYHLTHNFGHGEQYLSMLLLSLNLLAFLIHTALHLTDPIYAQLRHELRVRKTFFNDLRALTRYLLFDNWSHLLNFMFTQLELDQRAPP
ncbi:MAG: ISNCY family transposase [Acidobacteriota bacterium]